MTRCGRGSRFVIDLAGADLAAELDADDEANER